MCGYSCIHDISPSIVKNRKPLRIQVNSVVKKASFHLRNIGKVRKLLTEDATKKVMQNLVISRIDYVNALLSGVQQYTIAKLQRLQI